MAARPSPLANKLRKQLDATAAKHQRELDRREAAYLDERANKDASINSLRARLDEIAAENEQLRRDLVAGGRDTNALVACNAEIVAKNTVIANLTNERDLLADEVTYMRDTFSRIGRGGVHIQSVARIGCTSQAPIRDAHG